MIYGYYDYEVMIMIMRVMITMTSALLFKRVFLSKGAEISQVINSDPGIAIGRLTFFFNFRLFLSN